MARSILAIGVALSANSAAAQTAQTWQTVDDMLPHAWAYGITADNAGNIFAAGAARDSLDRATAVVMKSSDGGQTWDNDPNTPEIEEPSDAISSTTNTQAEFRAIASARVVTGVNTFEDHLVTIGRVNNTYSGSSVFNPWIVRRSTDAGANWGQVDDFLPPYKHWPGDSVQGGVAIDSSGTIYAVGAVLESIVTYKGKNPTTTYVRHWLIRKGVPQSDGTVGWTTSDIPYPGWGGGNCFPSGVACVGNNVFVVGGGGTDGVYWHVLKSGDGGTTWTVVDNFRFDRSDTSHAYGIAADSAGNLFVVGKGGRVSQNTAASYWIVRKGTANGTSWTTVDQFQYPGGNAVAYAVAVDRNNDVHVTGTGWSAATPQRWIARQRSAVTGLWATTDDFAYASTGSSVGKGIVADPFGNVFAAGYATDSAGAYHWLVRRKLAP